MSTDELVKRTIAWGEKHKINNMWSQASKVTEEWGDNRIGCGYRTEELNLMMALARKVLLPLAQ